MISHDNPTNEQINHILALKTSSTQRWPMCGLQVKSIIRNDVVPLAPWEIF